MCPFCHSAPAADLVTARREIVQLRESAQILARVNSHAHQQQTDQHALILLQQRLLIERDAERVQLQQRIHALGSELRALRAELLDAD